jgi:integrase
VPRIKLTQAAANKLKPPTEGNVTFWDTQCPGFGVRISAKGRRTWVAMYRVGKKPVMESLGTMALLPSVAEARARARASMTRAREGTNSVAERREAEAKERTRIEANAFTFSKAAERFLREHVERNCAPGYAYEVRRILEHDVFPFWGERPIREIAKRDVNELLDAKAERRDRRRKGTKGGAAIQANRTLTRLKTLFRWAVDMELIAADPTLGVRARVKEKARDRALDEDEIRWFWQGCEEMGWPFGPVFRLLLLTAQRRDEVGRMCWGELDLDKRQWMIPRGRAKSDRAHIVHLSEPAIGIIEALPRTGELVFSATGATAVSGYSRAKERIDHLMTAEVRVESGDPEAEIAPWILHDLRRSAATGMARLGVAPHVVDKILNHSSGAIRGVAAVYNRHAYLDERKVALEAWGRCVGNLVRGSVRSNVVQLGTGTAD